MCKDENFMKDFNAKGYTLIVTVVMITVFTIAFVWLFSALLSGAKRSEFREEVTQALELAEKGMEHMKSYLHKELVNRIGEEGLTYTKYVDEIEALLQRHTCDSGQSLQSKPLKTGSYEVCILDYEDVSEGQYNQARKKVKLKSIGKTKDQTKEMIYIIELGTKNIPDALKYALSTVNPKDERKDSDGNIYLHGGIEIYGDINVGNHLFTHPFGPGLTSHQARWRGTTLPILYPVDSKNQHSKIELGGGLYQFKDDLDVFTESKIENKDKITQTSSREFYNNHIEWRNLSHYQLSTIDQMFANTWNPPKVVHTDTKLVEVDISGTMDEYKSQLKTAIKETRDKISNLKTRQGISFINQDTIQFENNNIFPVGEIKNSKKVKFKKGSHQFDQLYIKGDVEIGNMNRSTNQGVYDAVTIKGFTQDRGALLFVDGDVRIQGANLTSNLTIYTTGKVIIEYSTIKGNKYLDREGSLILFSKDSIYIANNSLYLDEPSELKGFFYSEEALEMFGVGSNMQINGGIAARRITLNAIRGRYKDGGKSWDYVAEPMKISSPSRLIIKYDEDLIENYLNMNQSEPIVKEVDDTSLIDRK